MSGTKEGGLKSAKTIKDKYGKDFYKNLARKGGRISSEKGFASSKVGRDGFAGPERAKLMGSLGGALSRRKQVEEGIDYASGN